jgi:hypothetical protein
MPTTTTIWATQFCSSPASLQVSSNVVCNAPNATGQPVRGGPRRDLLPNACHSTPWQTLPTARKDHAYITAIGLEVKTFEYLLKVGFAHRWNVGTISREDVSSRGLLCRGRRSLGADGGLGLGLHYLYSTVLQPILFEFSQLNIRSQKIVICQRCNSTRRCVDEG